MVVITTHASLDGAKVLGVIWGWAVWDPLCWNWRGDGKNSLERSLFCQQISLSKNFEKMPWPICLDTRLEEFSFFLHSNKVYWSGYSFTVKTLEGHKSAKNTWLHNSSGRTGDNTGMNVNIHFCCGALYPLVEI